MLVPAERPRVELGPREQPAWIIRYGIWLIVGGFVLLFAVAALIPFANVVTAPVAFASANSPQAMSEGRVHLLVREGEVVSAGQRVAVVEPLRPVSSAVIFVPKSVAASIHPPQEALIDAGGRRIPATITAVLGAEGDRVPLRLEARSPLPPNTRGTVSIRLDRVHLLRQLLGMTTQ